MTDRIRMTNLRDFDPGIERDCLKVILELCDEIRGDIAYFGDDEGDFLSNRRYQLSTPLNLSRSAGVPFKIIQTRIRVPDMFPGEV